MNHVHTAPELSRRLSALLEFKQARRRFWVTRDGMCRYRRKGSDFHIRIQKKTRSTCRFPELPTQGRLVYRPLAQKKDETRPPLRQKQGENAVRLPGTGWKNACNPAIRRIPDEMIGVSPKLQQVRDRQSFHITAHFPPAPNPIPFLTVRS